jgi:hypothetical protein
LSCVTGKSLRLNFTNVPEVPEFGNTACTEGGEMYLKSNGIVLFGAAECATTNEAVPAEELAGVVKVNTVVADSTDDMIRSGGTDVPVFVICNCDVECTFARPNTEI